MYPCFWDNKEVPRLVSNAVVTQRYAESGFLPLMLKARPAGMLDSRARGPRHRAWARPSWPSMARAGCPCHVGRLRVGAQGACRRRFLHLRPRPSQIRTRRRIARPGRLSPAAGTFEGLMLSRLCGDDKATFSGLIPCWAYTWAANSNESSNAARFTLPQSCRQRVKKPASKIDPRRGWRRVWLRHAPPAMIQRFASGRFRGRCPCGQVVEVALDLGQTDLNKRAKRAS